MEVQKCLEKYKKVHIDTRTLTNKVLITCKCLGIFLVVFIFIRAPVTRSKLQVLEKFSTHN